jgi:predicted dehydrogenase
MGLLHGAIINVLNNSKLVAVCDPFNKTMLGAFKRFGKGIQVFDDVGLMIDSVRLDGVFITTPSNSHAELGILFANRGINIFVEKPLAHTLSDAKRMAMAVEKAKVISMVGLMMRYADTFLKAKEIIDNNNLGKIISIGGSSCVSQVFSEKKGWRYSTSGAGGGVLITQGIHAIDLMQWYLGMPEKVICRTKNYYSKFVEDFADVWLEWKKGVWGKLESSWSVDNKRMLEIKLSIVGENGDLFVSDDLVRLFLKKNTNSLKAGWSSWSRVELFTGVPVDIGGNYFTKQDMDFIDAIVSNTKIESDMANGLRVQKIVEACYESANNNSQAVEV